jgi:pimeloyl-ACP methyl ester carboxylesterase
MIIIILLQRLFSLVSLAILAVGVWLTLDWWDHWSDLRAFEGPEAADAMSRGPLYLGLALLAWSLLGGLIVPFLVARGGGDRGRLQRGGEQRAIQGADGSRIHVEEYGPADAPVLVLTHGWGMDSTTWWDARRALADRYRIITWDLPGLGRSSQPEDGYYRIERLAQDLETVVGLAGSARVILVGHSIGGMISQTLLAQRPDALGGRIAGLVLENTTHTNPLLTMIAGRAFEAIRRPVLEPMMRLDMALNPLVWLLRWQSYLSGSTHLAFRIAGFGNAPTRAQVNQAALLATRNSPKVQAKGNLAMFRWSVTDRLPAIRVPTLVFTGNRDIVTLPVAGETIADRIADARLHRVPGAGHMGPMEHAEIYNAAILDFADEVFTRGAQSADSAARPAAAPSPASDPRGDGRGDGVRPPPSV